MARLDSYLRSIERFGASGAVLTSGHTVTLRFPNGDRHATQVTSHDQLVALMREVAPPALLDQLDQQRPVRFELDSGGRRYLIQIAARPGAWQVSIEPVQGGPPPRRAHTPSRRPPTALDDVAIERGQYDAPLVATRTAPSGSAFLDLISHAARAAHASDVFLAAGAPVLRRIRGELDAIEPAALIDGDQLARELGVVSPQAARAAWAEHGAARFAYGDGAGRIRVVLGRDRNGPTAALRLLPDEPPPLDLAGLAAIEPWLAERGAIVVAGGSGAGKTVAIAAIVRALGERRRRVVAIEDPIELVHAGPWVCQRAVGVEVASVELGVAAAMREGADAIAVGAVDTGAAAAAIADAVAGGHLVIAGVVAPAAPAALDRIAGLLGDAGDGVRRVLGAGLVGTVHAVVGRSGERTFDVVARER